MNESREVVCMIEIQGLYDGYSATLYSDGEIVNRWATGEWKGSRLHYATQAWIDEHGDRIRAEMLGDEA